MTKSTKYSDQEILTRLLDGGKRFEQIVSYLNLTHSGMIGEMQAKVGLSRENAMDAYTDAILKLIRQVRDGKFRGESKLSTYFYKIFYFTAVDISRKKTTHEMEIDLNSLSQRETLVFEALSSKQHLEDLNLKMQMLGKECKSILIDWAYGHYSMKEIALRNTLKNEESARSMKYKCLKKLKSLMRNQ